MLLFYQILSVRLSVSFYLPGRRSQVWSANPNRNPNPNESPYPYSYPYPYPYPYPLPYP